MWRLPWRWFWTLGLVLILLVVGTSNYERYLATSDRPADAYPVLSLEGYHRLLVVAPHCDDETLAAAGLIQAARRRGMDIRVVIATAGDGYIRATATWFRRPPRAADFVALGEMRQRESLAALAHLGLDEKDAVFLTYPERRIGVLWWSRWDTPDRSPFTGRTRNLYPRAFQFNAPYTGQALLEDLRTLLKTFRPDLIVFPHPNDVHPDHRALSVFVRLAVAMEEDQDSDYRPRLLGYLVHYGRFPQPVGLKPQAFLLPPRPLDALEEWVQWPLAELDVAAKGAAVEEYHSQLKVLGRFLRSFVRQNELFALQDAVTSLGIVDGAIWQDPEEVQRNWKGTDGLVREPVKDNVIRWVAAGADISHMMLFRAGDSLWVGIELRRPPTPAYDYRISLRAVFPNGESTARVGRWGAVRQGEWEERGRFLWYRVDLEELGSPTWIALTAETRQGEVLDFTAWYLLYLGK
ncbi:MAG: PIG-L family deacetylase [Thermoflexales bacterium]|nr:PIG-L family deacetylase [Thermoflexales bacterium]